MAEKGRHILYTVLDWGLGHATRSIPVIRYLISKGIKVSFAGEGESLSLLKTEFPECTTYLLTGINVYYPDKGSLALSMLLRIPGILNSIRKEHLQFEKLIDQIKPDAVISDSRFGVWTKKVPCVFITHQLWIKMPGGFGWMEPMLFEINKRRIRKFKQVWVPDFPGAENLSGDLAHHPKAIKQLLPVFIGPLSRFDNIKNADTPDRYDVLMILSGPEPQRTAFEKLCIEQAKKVALPTLIVRGKPSEKQDYRDGKIRIVSHLPSEILKSHIEKTKYIICRPGYSTIMDLTFLNKPAICIPTPGQTEQEYLGKFLAAKGTIICSSQSDFDLKSKLELTMQELRLMKNADKLMKDAIDLMTS